IATIAPIYPRASDELERAQQEADLLVSQFAAHRVAGTRSKVRQLLERGLEECPVAIVHFAGHGNFRADLANASYIKLEDGQLSADEVGTQEVKLGVLSGPLVVFNACEVGATGAELGMVGGWAESFLRRRFRGFIGPLWAVDDDHARDIVAELFVDLMRERLPVAQALHKIRQKHGETSPSFLAYLFFGDARARLDAEPVTKAP